MAAFVDGTQKRGRMASSEVHEGGSLLAVGEDVTLQRRRFHVHSKIYSGPFSEVYVVSDDEDRYALKVERTVGCLKSVLKLDVAVLSKFARSGGTCGFPRLVVAGRTPNYKFAVLELIGPDLQRLRQCFPDRKFSLGTALHASLKTLDRIEALHNAGWLCRDVKANNFAIGRRKNAGVIYMLDFGFAKRFLSDQLGSSEVPEDHSSFLGTILYAPLAAHYYVDQSCKDDVESWLYMSIEMITGKLPWMKFVPRTEYMLIGEFKKYARNSGREDLLEGCPTEYDDILTLIDNTPYNRRPDYRLIRAYLLNAMDRLNIPRVWHFEWEMNRRILRRARSVDKGEQSATK